MKFSRDVTSTFLTEVAIVVLNLVAGVVMARLLPPTDRGILALVMVLPVTMAYFVDIGISQAIIYLVARQKRPPAAVIGNAMLLALILGITGAAVLGAVRFWLFPRFLQEVPAAYLLVVLSLLPLLLVDTYLLSILRSQQRFDLFNLRRLMTSILLLLAVIILVGFIGWGLTGGVAAFVFSQLLSILITIWLVRRILVLRLEYSRELTVESLSFGLKSYLQNLVGHLHYRLDIYILALFLPPAQVAFYTVATSIAEVAFYVPDSVGTVLFPKLSGLSDDRVHTMTAEVTRHTLFITVLLSIILLPVGTWLIPLIYGSAYRPSVAPFLVLVPGVLMMAIFKVITRNFSSRNQQQVTVLVSGAALVLNLVLNLFLIPRLGVVGAAFASSVTYSFAAGILIWVFLSISGIPFGQMLFLKKSDLQHYREFYSSIQAGLRSAIHSSKQPGKPGPGKEIAEPINLTQGE